MSEQQPRGRWLLPPDEILALQQAGSAAAETGQEVGTCPHRPDPDGTAEERNLARFRQLMWVRGFRQRRQELEAERPVPV